MSKAADNIYQLIDKYVVAVELGAKKIERVALTPKQYQTLLNEINKGKKIAECAKTLPLYNGRELYIAK